MKRPIPFLAACALAGLIAGCGGGNDTPVDGSSSGSSTIAAQQSLKSPWWRWHRRGDTLLVTVAGGGSVISSPAGIDCTGSGGCSKAFPVGSTVTLSAVPSAGQTFVGWTGECSGSGLSCVVTVSAMVDVGANFAPGVQLEPLQVTIGGAGTVSSSPTGINCTGAGSCVSSFTVDTKVTLTATPASGNSFVGWSGACSGSATNCTVQLTAAEGVAATFAAVAAGNGGASGSGGTGGTGGGTGGTSGSSGTGGSGSTSGGGSGTSSGPGLATSSYVISWSAVNSALVTGYQVYYSILPFNDAGASVKSIPVGLTSSYTFNPGAFGILSGTNVYVAVAAVGSGGLESPLSSVVWTTVQ